MYITFNVIFGIVLIDLTEQMPRQKQHQDNIIKLKSMN